MLIVEDNQDAAASLAALVELWGHDVRVTVDAVLIALSGYWSNEDKQAAIDAGFDHHLVKPPNLAHLAELLMRVALDRRDDAASTA